MNAATAVPTPTKAPKADPKPEAAVAEDTTPVVDLKKQVFSTELELRANVAPDKCRAYRVALDPAKAATEAKYIYAAGPDAAILRVARAAGATAAVVGKVPDKDSVFNEMMSLPPEHLKELLAKINASAYIPGGQPPTGNSAATKNNKKS